MGGVGVYICMYGLCVRTYVCLVTYMCTYVHVCVMTSLSSTGLRVSCHNCTFYTVQCAIGLRNPKASLGNYSSNKHVVSAQYWWEPIQVLFSPHV